MKSNVVVSEAGRIWAYLARGSLGVPESLRAGHRPPELIAPARWQGPEQTQEVVPARHADGGADELEGGATNQCSRATEETEKTELLKISSVALTNFPRVLFAHSNLDSTHRARIDPSS